MNNKIFCLIIVCLVVMTITIDVHADDHGDIRDNVVHKRSVTTLRPNRNVRGIGPTEEVVVVGQEGVEEPNDLNK